MRRLDVLGGLTGRIRKGLRQVRLRQRAGMASVAQTRETSAVGGARRAGEAVDALKAVFQRDVAETALLGAGNVHGGSGAAMRLIKPA